MDPFIIAIMDNQKQKGKVMTDAGKNPKFSDVFTFKRTKEPSVFLEIRDKDDISADDLIGFAEVKIDKIAQMGRVAEWYDVFYKKKSAGKILVEAEFFPEGGSQQQQFPQ